MCSRAYQDHLDSQEGCPDDDNEPNGVERFHDEALFAFYDSAADLHALGYSVRELVEKLTRHLTPENVPFESGRSDPFAA